MKVDQIEPKKVDRYDKLGKEWNNVKELMLYNVDKDSQDCSSRKDLELYFETKF